jgi:hypothetical protein
VAQDERADRGARLGVEAAGRLVHEQHRGVARQRAGEQQRRPRRVRDEHGVLGTYGPAAGRDLAGQHAQEHALPGSARPQHTMDLPVADGEADPAEHGTMTEAQFERGGLDE